MEEVTSSFTEDTSRPEKKRRKETTIANRELEKNVDKTKDIDDIKIPAVAVKIEKRKVLSVSTICGT